jgi:hypothetical protein
MHVVWPGNGRKSTQTPKDWPLTDSRSDMVSEPGQLGPFRGHSLVAPSAFYRVVMLRAGPMSDPPFPTTAV